MTDIEEIIKIVNLLAQNEQVLADMYFAYSKEFPTFKLWNFLNEEEKKHNCLVLSILENVEDGSIQFSDMHFSVRTINIAINQVKEEISVVEKGGRNLEQAIEFAIKVEKSMLEKNFLNYFSSDDLSIQKVLDELKTDTKSHQNVLESALDKFKKEKEYNSYESIVKRINKEQN
ncbi:MAG: hypothetical protein PF574_10345 [Candidatus Delongbacteria bacterium]|nr:hypothetical protein [Candidatus Delongbacteria bacterium]